MHVPQSPVNPFQRRYCWVTLPCTIPPDRQPCSTARQIIECIRHLNFRLSYRPRLIFGLGSVFDPRVSFFAASQPANSQVLLPEVRLRQTTPPNPGAASPADLISCPSAPLHTSKPRTSTSASNPRPNIPSSIPLCLSPTSSRQSRHHVRSLELVRRWCCPEAEGHAEECDPRPADTAGDAPKARGSPHSPDRGAGAGGAEKCQHKQDRYAYLLDPPAGEPLCDSLTLRRCDKDTNSSASDSCKGGTTTQEDPRAQPRADPEPHRDHRAADERNRVGKHQPGDLLGYAAGGRGHEVHPRQAHARQG